LVNTILTLDDDDDSLRKISSVVAENGAEEGTSAKEEGESLPTLLSI